MREEELAFEERMRIEQAAEEERKMTIKKMKAILRDEVRKMSED